MRPPFPTPPVDLDWITDVDGVSADFVCVTPHLAKLWLDANLINRNLRLRNVERYRADITAGDWALTGEAVQFSDTGRLLNGQHRLLAVSRSLTPLPMLVVRGLDNTAQKYMDQGTARTTAQRFTLDGERNTHVLAAVAKLAISIDRIGPAHGYDPAWAISQPQQEHWVAANPDIRSVLERWSSRGPLGTTKTQFAYVAFRVSRVDEFAAERYLSSLSTGAELPERSPLLAARNRLSNLHADNSKRPELAVVNLLFRAWNLWRKSESVRSLEFRVPPRGGLPYLV